LSYASDNKTVVFSSSDPSSLYAFKILNWSPSTLIYPGLQGVYSLETSVFYPAIADKSTLPFSLITPYVLPAYGLLPDFAANSPSFFFLSALSLGYLDDINSKKDFGISVSLISWLKPFFVCIISTNILLAGIEKFLKLCCF